MLKLTARSLFASIALAALSACNMAPAYHTPALPAPLPASFKADPNWHPATPADAVAKGAWWELFGDPQLNEMEARLAVTNQNIAAARAAWMQARAVVAESRSAALPSVSGSAGATHAGNFGSGPAATAAAATATSSYSANLSASWDIDLWGKLGNAVSQAKANAAASAGELANATLSAQATLASDYLSLRGVDAQKALAQDNVDADTRTLTVVRNQYAVGVVARSAVDSAQSALESAKAQALDLDRSRAAYEDAIAVLMGENPSSFHIAPADRWAPVMPDVPGVLPADILQRRPDIATAERQVAAANANIGIQRAAFFPALSLSATTGSSASSLSSLFSAATSFWSFGANLAGTLLDFGGRAAQVRGARAGYDQAVANYRQTALTAFQQVEDNLAALDAYRAEAEHLSAAQAAAINAATISRNEFNAGTIDYTTLATALTTANSARQALINDTVSRQTAAVALIEAIGGQWASGPDLANPEAPPPPSTH